MTDGSLPHPQDDLAAAAVEAIARIEAIPTILDIVGRMTGMGFAVVARVTEDRWITCGVRDTIDFGLRPGDELVVGTTICRQVRETDTAVVIDHVAQDEDYAEHPIPALYAFQSYIAVPIRQHDGTFFGTLCALDPKPAKINNPETIGMFRMFADLIAFHLDASDRLARIEARLTEVRATARLREQFIAVMGHDLRNPLAAIASGVRLLSVNPSPEKAARILPLMQASADRMAALIDNVLDLARGRLAGGLAMMRTPVDVGMVLAHLIDELQATHPDRAIEATIDLPPEIEVDRLRLGQLFSNLLGNALTHGSPAHPVRVQAGCVDDRFELSVTNGGEPLPPAMLAQVFEPFSRGTNRQGQGGLGLGLYIASEIAKGHGGTLRASSSPEATCFTFAMPLEQAPSDGVAPGS